MKIELVIADCARGYELKRNAEGQYFLTVLCGGVAQFDKTIALGPEEERLFSEWGKSFVDDLAYRISQAPEKFPGTHGSTE